MGFAKNLLAIGTAVSLVASPALAASKATKTATVPARVGTPVAESENLFGAGTLLTLLGLAALVAVVVVVADGPSSP